MTEESPLYRKQGNRANLLWRVLAGLALGSIFAVCFYFVLENESLSFFVDQWWQAIVLAYAIVVTLLFFTIGLLRGRATGNPMEGVGIIVNASLIQALTVLVLIGVFSQVFAFRYMDHYGVLFALFGTDLESGGFGAGWFLAQTLIVQIPMGIIIALIGGAIGNHFFHQQPNPGEAAQP